MKDRPLASSSASVYSMASKTPMLSSNVSAMKAELTSTTEPEMSSNAVTTDPELSSNEASTENDSNVSCVRKIGNSFTKKNKILICHQTQEKPSNSIAQEDGAGSDDNLLEPFRSSDIEQSPSSQESTNEDDLDCRQCNQSFQSVAGLRRHSMLKHNLHSIRPRRKVIVRNHFNVLFVAKSLYF